MMSTTLLFLVLAPIILPTECARILGIIPIASYSHQVPFQPLWRELSLRGHQVTVMTTNPMKDPTLTNLREIDLSGTYDIYAKYNATEIASDDTKTFGEITTMLKAMLLEAGIYQLYHPEVQELIHNKDIKFDLVMVEAQLPTMMVFSWRFSCPMIGIASLDSGMQYHLAMGNPVHPMVNPDLNLPVEDSENMSFKDRITSFLYYFAYSYLMYHDSYPKVKKLLDEVFKEDVPNVIELHDNMEMLFINTNPIFHSVRPLNPNTIPIGGGIHLRKPEPLPKDIQEFLDDATEGAIYFSLGTNVNSRMLNNIMQKILEVSREVPYKILVKINQKFEGLPENVKAGEWLPQQDILRHPNIKLFITQGGLQSLQEAVYNGIPLVAIPFMGDQISNVNRMVKKGYGVKLNKSNVTKDAIKEAIEEVMDNPKYRETAKELSDIYREEEVPSLQRAIWWTEYVIRHKGAKHLRSPVVDMPLWKYFMLDVIGFLVSVLALTVFMCHRIFKASIKLLRRSDESKVKVQ